jgi:FlaG/FlaF family flagellin (archaellin)
MILMFCEKCGSNLPDDSNYCEKCGALQNRPDPSKITADKNGTDKLEPGSSNVLKYVIIGIVGIIALVIIISAVLSYVSLGAGFGTIQTAHTAKVVAVTAQQPDSNHITVTYLGGQDADELVQLNADVTDSAGNTQMKSMTFFKQPTSAEVGLSFTFTGAFSGQDHVIVVGRFMGEEKQGLLEQVLLDTNI